MIPFEKIVERIKKQYPDMDDEEVNDLAYQWAQELAEEAEQREDTPCLDDPWWRNP